MTTDQRYPLSWPQGWPRKPAHTRRRAKFSAHGRPVSMHDAVRRLIHQLDRLHASSEVLSTDVELRLDGQPRSNQPPPRDPGAAVYFRLKGQARCLACDTWDRVEDNVVAIAQHIDALRRIDRYGVGTLDQAFAGYKALAAEASPWWVVLGFESRPGMLTTVEKRYTELAREHHPDRGGSSVAMAKINAARDAARLDLGG